MARGAGLDGFYCVLQSGPKELSRSRVGWMEERGRGGPRGRVRWFLLRIAVRPENKLRTQSFREVGWSGWRRRVGMEGPG